MTTIESEYARLKALAEKATKLDLSTAEIHDEGVYECPLCDGGLVDGEVFINHDNAPVGIQTFGIGKQYENNTAYVNSINDMMALIERLMEERKNYAVVVHLRSTNICAGCNKPITGSTTYYYGADNYHVECVPFTTARDAGPSAFGGRKTRRDNHD